MKIYTKTGDRGNTVLVGGHRVSKHDPRVEAYGTVDELNAMLGVVLSECPWEDIHGFLVAIQSHLFALGADLATPYRNKHEDKIERFTAEPVKMLEGWIDEVDAGLPEIRSFILPGGAYLAAQLHLARTVCRRAERHVSSLSEQEPINGHTLAFLNRLSDLLFILARYVNFLDEKKESIWQSRH
ncbi:MAG: ATP:cob(I)alamin adenosyltransferase [Candidatus Cloacimonetes bacterium 4572_55]|nr:MAG: ATP:cob(I)alamin adenosyltransferase [Candidatus Cloacimonetes bacterium 4572_55]